MGASLIFSQSLHSRSRSDTSTGICGRQDASAGSQYSSRETSSATACTPGQTPAQAGRQAALAASTSAMLAAEDKPLARAGTSGSSQTPTKGPAASSPRAQQQIMLLRAGIVSHLAPGGTSTGNCTMEELADAQTCCSVHLPDERLGANTKPCKSRMQHRPRRWGRPANGSSRPP